MSEIETKIAELAVSMVPNIDKIRFVSSGTEAVMSALRLARGYTGKSKVLKFEGDLLPLMSHLLYFKFLLASLRPKENNSEN